MAKSKTRLNPFLGPVKLFTKDYPATCPVSNNAVSWEGWKELGWHGEKGVNLDLKNKRDDMKVDEFNTPVDAYLAEEGATLSLGLKKLSVSEIADMISGANLTVGGADFASKVSGGGDTALSFFSAGMQGYAPSGEPLVLWIPRVTASDSLKMAFLKGDSELPIEFIGYADTTLPVGEQLWQLFELGQAGDGGGGQVI